VEGEATAVYLSKLLKPLVSQSDAHCMGVPCRQRSGIRDEVTMWKALEGRREL